MKLTMQKHRGPFLQNPKEHFKGLFEGWRDYRYDSLDKVNREIRLLRLLPGVISSALRGELITVSLNDSPIYDALSYMWGDPSPADAIYIRRRSLPIAANLSAALRHIREPDLRDTIIWVDAMCINQRDQAERNQQVSMMRNIYKQASTVRIWIPGVVGPADPAVLRLQQMNSTSTTKDFGDDPDLWLPLTPLFQHQYWKRVWIQQEVVNASKLQLHCGNVVVSHDALLQFQTLLRLRIHIALDSALTDLSWQTVLLKFGPFYAPALDIPSFRRWFDAGDAPSNPGTLLALLEGCSDLQVTDERDYVYGLMHLATDYEEGKIVVDYDKTLDEVFKSAIAFHVGRHRNVDFLCQTCQEPEEERLSRGMPTWIPRWPSKSFGAFPINRGYGAAAQTVCLNNPISNDGNHLQIHGFQVDYVDRVDRTLGHQKEITIAQVWQFVCRLALQLRPSGVPPGTGFPVPLALWDIFTVRHSTEEHESYETMERAMRALRQLAHTDGTRDLLVGDHGISIARELNKLDQDVQNCIFGLFLSMDGRLAITTRGNRVGIMPLCAIEEGDEIWVIFGCHMPVVLRRQITGLYVLVGPTYISGLMEGELVKSLPEQLSDGSKCGPYTIQTLSLA